METLRRAFGPLDTQAGVMQREGSLAGVTARDRRAATRRLRLAAAAGCRRLRIIASGRGAKVSKGRPQSPLGSEAFVASGDKEKAERVSRNERPLAATIEAADAPAGAKPLPLAK